MEKKFKKLKCAKHNQHLFYVYINTETGNVGTICQVCEDETIAKSGGLVEPSE